MCFRPLLVVHVMLIHVQGVPLLITLILITTIILFNWVMVTALKNSCNHGETCLSLFENGR